GNNVPLPFTSFEETGFPFELLREVLQAGFTTLTPIQAQSWPIALRSRDVVAVAKTGATIKILKSLLFVCCEKVRSWVSLSWCNCNGAKMGLQVLVPFRSSKDLPRHLKLIVIAKANVVINLIGREYEIRNYNLGEVNHHMAAQLAKVENGRELGGEDGGDGVDGEEIDGHRGKRWWRRWRDGGKKM
nr:DEAD-box ATP-dependent RNA helicase 14-like [Tanacetum cinerariifolium]